jgi:gluconate 2-dehydrogenase gamma chain
MERRELIGWLVATAGLQCLESLAPQDLLALGRDVHLRGSGRALGSHALQTVATAAERIIPATDTPGATDAGVAAFIDKMVTDWYTPVERTRFQAGLPELDTRCRARAGKDFVSSAESVQVAVLTELDSEAAGSRDHWFAMLKFLTVYGYCTSEPGMRALGLHPLPGRYDGCAPIDAAH